MKYSFLKVDLIANLIATTGQTDEDFSKIVQSIAAIFDKIKSDTTINDFKEGLSSYLASNYYKYRSKKKGTTQSDLSQLKKKLKVGMGVLSNSVREEM